MAVKPRVVVVGSANMDLVVRVEHIPAPGETVLGGQFLTVPGGKGANQAVATARLGGRVCFVGCVGRDPFGDGLLASLRADSIDTTYTRRDADYPSGVALIGVDAQGQNAITVAPGANHRLTPSDVEAALPAIETAHCVIIQLEIPLETVAHAIALAHRSGVRVILNPAPVRHTHPLPTALLSEVDVLIPNEHEAANLLGYASSEGLEMEALARQLLALGPKQIVITLGGEGCLLASANGIQRLPAVPVVPVDTTAAGDCFTGALAVGLAEGHDLEFAALFACRAAALSVTRSGAQPSLPTRDELG